MTASSSPFEVLPATSTSRPGEIRKKRRTRSRPRPGASRDQCVEFEAAGHGDTTHRRRAGPAGAPSSLCTQKIDVAEDSRA